MFTDAKQGDQFKRLLGGVVPMIVTVAKVEDGLITMYGGWTFDAATGAEVDPDLNWGPAPLMTGSYLTKE